MAPPPIWDDTLTWTTPPEKPNEPRSRRPNDIRDGFRSDGDPPRRALAILALDPRSGSVVWSQDLEPPIHMVADPVPVAGGLVLPTWRAPPVMVRAVGAVG